MIATVTTPNRPDMTDSESHTETNGEIPRVSPAAPPFTVVVIDRQRTIAEALGQALARHPDFNSAGVASTAEQALALLQTAPPDVVVADLSSDVFADPQLVGELRAAGTQVVCLTDRMTPAVQERAEAAGAVLVLTRDRPLQETLDSIAHLAAHPESFSGEPRHMLDSAAKPEGPLAALTPRQIEILRELALGKRTKEIAQFLHLSIKAIDSHKYRIMSRLGIHDRVELARLAIREGLIQA